MRKEINYQFLILQAIAIILVVVGHKGGINLLADWFPIYSFHMPLFVFISGYFYKKGSDIKLKKFIIKKIKSLLMPYLIWNIIYGVILTILKVNNIVTFGKKISLETLFITPWVNGHQFIFNLSAWFVLSLFIIQILYLFFRKIYRHVNFKNEYLIMMVFLFIGCIGVIYANKGYITGWDLIIVRTTFLMPFYHMGYLYNQKLEIKDNMNNTMYFIGLFIVQFILIKKYGDISFSALNCDSFNKSNILLPYITSITGIMLWLRISRILVPSLKDSKVINYIGSNTWTIMMHHFFVFFLINVIFAMVTPILNLRSFDYKEFTRDIGYSYIPGSGIFMFFYVLLGIAIPLIVKYYMGYVNKYIKEKFNMKYITYNTNDNV